MPYDKAGGTRENARARVLIIYTGGTIGMVPQEPGNPSSPLVPATKEQVLEYVPQLGLAEGIYWEIRGLVDDGGNVVPPLDSSDVNAAHWLYMASLIERQYAEFDGFVILHGTDTMAYTASALSFLLSNLAKPVVLTGSQLPIFNTRTDAVQNLASAVYIAGWKATGLPLVPEVTICFGELLLRGNRVRKVSTSSWQGFQSPNFPALGHIGEHIKINQDLVWPPADNNLTPFFAHKHLHSEVMDIGLFPGLKPSQLESVLRLPALRGVILRTFGAGNAPSYEDFLDVISSAINESSPPRVVVNVTHCLEGMVEMGLYAASSELLERGVISGLDMTPEAALTKLMWILATEAGEEVQIQMQISQRGEQSVSLFDVRYGSAGRSSEPQEQVTLSARPSGQFRKERFTRAVVRLSGVGFTDTADGDTVDLRVYMNAPWASANTPNGDVHLVAHINCPYREPRRMRLVQDVTDGVRKLAEEGRPITLTVVPGGGKKIWIDGLYLALFTRS